MINHLLRLYHKILNIERYMNRVERICHFLVCFYNISPTILWSYWRRAPIIGEVDPIHVLVELQAHHMLD